MAPMFKNKENRYLTKSIQIIPLSIQLALWQLIDVTVEPNVQRDYFQNFDLRYEEGSTKEVIFQHQEVSERAIALSIELSVLGLEGGLNQTMLLPADY